MKRGREPIPNVKSAFLLVKCPDCQTERIIFSNSAKDIGCSSCGKKLAESRGGKSLIFVTEAKKLG
ncbi:MAG: 30S ribosomal protein S27e [Thaumarchaeota archaeon]|nr:30S ribosomal protein S27e [Nitrososphaerota archaeon]